MTRQLPEIDCELMVIGTGMAGMSAALFAARRGIDTVQAGLTGELMFASGFLDLMGVHPVADGTVWQNPWKAVEAVVRDIPQHPYAHMGRQRLQAAMDAFLGFLAHAGLPYRTEPDTNLQVITPAGTIKTTYAVPYTAYNGVEAYRTRRPCLVVGFEGLKGFSSRQISQQLHRIWPDLKRCRVAFPGRQGELYPEQMANALHIDDIRSAMVAAIRPHIGRCETIALPAILGIHQGLEVFENLQRQLGLPLFEIPTMPPSIAGQRLKSIFEQHLPQLGVHTHFQNQVFGVRQVDRSGFVFEVGTREPELLVRASNALLATGRFFGKGLTADRHRIKETIFGLPVRQPQDRNRWHRRRFLDPRGHRVNRAGIETDRHLRPLNAKGRPVYPNLFAAGSILAHQDWMRMKCGSGLAIATAYAAVEAITDRCHA